jgi:uncharacterized membrane protein
MTLLDAARVVLPTQRAESAPGRHARVPAASPAERVGWSVAAVVGLFGVLHAWTASVASPAAAVATPLLVGICLLALQQVWTRRAIGWPVQLGLLLVTTGALCLRALQVVRVSPGYGTDALAFNEYAARQLLEGTNPYAVSMAPSLDLFQVPPDFSTFRLDGSAVEALSYPAGSVLAYVPPLALGMGFHAGTLVNLICWVASAVLLWRLLPATLRWLAPVLMGLSVYTEYVLGGVTDTVWLPFVLLAVYKWDRFADPTAGWVRWVSPLALGTAMSVKQTPWFLLPFLVVALALEARARGLRPWRAPVGYVAVALAVFLAVNLPFIVWDPGAWFAGAALPLIESTVPDGQGLVSLALYAGLGGGALQLFSLAGALVVVVSLAALLLYYDVLKRAWVFLVPLAFFFPTRSLASYLIMLIPAAVLAATTVSSAPARDWALMLRWRKPALGVLLGALGVASALALAVPSPVSVSVVEVRSTGAWQTISEVVVRVENRSDDALPVRYTLNDDGRTTSFWQASDPTPVPAGAVRELSLRAPDVASMPDVERPFRVMAFTEEPAAVSASAPYATGQLSVSLSPMSVPGEVPAGKPVEFTAQLRDQRGVPVARAGVPVSLSQVVYAETALLPGNATINGGPQGQSPALVTTDEQGRATFLVRGVQAQRDPVYFQAWISNPGASPHGYSPSVLVHFVP